MQTGFYGIPGTKETTKVHFVNEHGPICRARLRLAMEFQWCSHGWRFKLVECDRCRNIANRDQRSPYE